MKTARLGLIVSFILGFSINAQAVSLTLEGAGTGVSVGNAQALWASDGAGRAVQITAVGIRAPSGGQVSELGVPSMMPDGRVVFKGNSPRANIPCRMRSAWSAAL